MAELVACCFNSMGVIGLAASSPVPDVGEHSPGQQPASVTSRSRRPVAELPATGPAILLCCASSRQVPMDAATTRPSRSNAVVFCITSDDGAYAIAVDDEVFQPRSSSLFME